MESWDESTYLTPLSPFENEEQLSQSDSSESVISSARDNCNRTINQVGLGITYDTITDGGEKNNCLKRRRNREIGSLTMEAVEKYVGLPIDEAAMSLAVSRSALKCFCREHGIHSWPFPKHNKRAVDVTDSKLSRISQSSQNMQDVRFGLFGVVFLLVRIKRWSCSSKHHGLSGKWWSCGKHNYPAYKSDSICQVVRLMLYLKRWRKRDAIKCAMLNNDCLMSAEQIVASVVLDDNKAGKKRKRIDLPISGEEIREHCGKTMAKVVNNIDVISTYEEAATLVLHQQEQTNLLDGLALFKQIKREQFIEYATASTVKQLTIEATYNENMVKFPFTILDGLVKLEEMVAARFQLRLDSFKLKYEDEDNDMILVSCDNDLMLLTGDPIQPVNQPVTRLLVLPIANDS